MEHPRHFASLDGLRGLAALGVAIPHFFLFRGTQSAILEFISVVAVEVFFVLSGFVLAAQLNQCFRHRPAECRRVLRAPLDADAAALHCDLVAMTIVTRNYFNADFFEYLFFVRNFAWVKPDNDFFLVAWSLAIEEWFYLVFPMFLLLFTRAGSSALRAAGFSLRCSYWQN